MKYDSSGLKGRVAVVTGGGRGIGKAISAILADSGAKVVVADVDEASARQTSKELADPSGDVIGSFVDVAQEESVSSLMQMALESFGRIDILVNNAGIMYRTRLMDISLDEWEQTLQRIRVWPDCQHFLFCRAECQHTRRGSLYGFKSRGSGFNARRCQRSGSFGDHSQCYMSWPHRNKDGYGDHNAGGTPKIPRLVSHPKTGLAGRNWPSCRVLMFGRSGIHHRSLLRHQRRRPDDLKFSIASKGERQRMKFTL